MGVAVLDYRVQATQVVPVGPRDVLHLQCVQDRLVVLVHQHSDPLPRPAVQRTEQISQTPKWRLREVLHETVALDGGQLLRHTCLQMAGLVEVPAAEAQLDHRVAQRPVPALVDMQPLKKFPASLEQLFERVEEQALAEASRARQEVMRAFLHQPQSVAGLVHVVAVALAELAEALDADRKQAPSHCTTYNVPLTGPSSKRARAPRAAASGLAVGPLS